MSFKSILKPEGSTVAGLATVGAVFGVYQLNLGTVAQAAATDPNHPVLGSSRRKAGYTSLALVSALTLITRDANVFILGCGTIIAMELSYRHGIMANPQNMQMQNPNPNTAYEPAENVIPFNYQGETG
jgi:hypothetical protein